MHSVGNKIKSAIECLQAGRLKDAEEILGDILDSDSQNVSALHFLGVLAYQQKEYDSALTYIRKSLHLGPDYVDAHNNLGSVLQDMGRLDEAIESYQRALELSPNFSRAHYNLGTALKEKWQIDEAIYHYREAIRIAPNLVEAYNNIGLALQDQGRLQEAEQYYRQALRLKPDFALCYSNLLLLLNYAPHDAQSVFDDHLRFAGTVAEPLYPPVVRYGNDWSPLRRLRIGYVSPDFRRHSVNYFIEPVLASHSHDRFEVFCYSDVFRPDNVTERLRGHADQWRNIAGLPDERVAELIQRDGIDILIDLAGHTGHNRMPLFARKPAPVQVTWLGYPNTTGLATMDYRIVDSFSDPVGLTDPFYAERLLRMPQSFLCYLPWEDGPAVGDLPAKKSGFITFGSFNYFPKVSDKTAACWAAILKAMPGSRLIMKSRNFLDRSICRYALEMFAKLGIPDGRIELLSAKVSFEEHLTTYNYIDIALDTFPYNGTTTTCESLWMGVPVITLAGNTHASRVGLSILSNIGLSELAAKTYDEYVAMAVALSRDVHKLQFFRTELRRMMSDSPLMDAKKFCQGIENVYRAIWVEWCEKGAIRP